MLSGVAAALPDHAGGHVMLYQENVISGLAESHHEPRHPAPIFGAALAWRLRRYSGPSNATLGFAEWFNTTPSGRNPQQTNLLFWLRLEKTDSISWACTIHLHPCYIELPIRVQFPNLLRRCFAAWIPGFRKHGVMDVYQGRQAFSRICTFLNFHEIILRSRTILPHRTAAA